MANKNDVSENPSGSGKEETGPHRGLSAGAWTAIASIAVALIAGTFTLLTHLIPPASREQRQSSDSSAPAVSSSSNSARAEQSIAPSTSQSNTGESSHPTRFPNSCLNHILAVIPDVRREAAAIEGGETDIIKETPSTDGLAGVLLVANNRPVGAITFTPTYVNSQNYSFKVEHLLNSTCEERPYDNIDHPEYKPVLHNWDRIKTNLDDHEYWIRLGYNTQTHAISAKFLDKEIH
jgi:hypothetical protein